MQVEADDLEQLEEALEELEDEARQPAEERMLCPRCWRECVERQVSCVQPVELGKIGGFQQIVSARMQMMNVWVCPVCPNSLGHLIRHLPGRHDQKTHGHRGGNSSESSSGKESSGKAGSGTKGRASKGKGSKKGQEGPPRKFGSPEETNSSALQKMPLAKKNTVLRQETKEWQEKLSPEEVAAVRQYTGKDFVVMNNALRAGPPYPAELKDAIEQTTSALNKGSLSDAVVSYRGMTDASEKHWNFYQAAVGKTLTDPGFSSTSLDSKVATSYMHRSPTGIHMEVHLPKGVPGCYAATFSKYPSEREYLLPPGMKYKVLSASVDSTGQRRIVLAASAPA